MVDKNKFQVDLLKEILSKDCRMKRTQTEDGFVGIGDGYYLIIFHESDLRVKLDGVREFKYDFSDAKKEHPHMVDSKIRQAGQRVYAKLISDDGTATSYVNEKFLNKFKGCEFFSDGETAPVYVKDGMGELVGVICPVRCSGRGRF